MNCRAVCQDIDPTLQTGTLKEDQGNSSVQDESYGSSDISEAWSEVEEEFDEDWRPGDNSEDDMSLENITDGCDAELYDMRFQTNVDEVLQAAASTLMAGDEVQYVKATDGLEGESFAKKAIVTSIQPLTNGGHTVRLDNKDAMFTSGGYIVQRIRAMSKSTGTLVDTPMPLWLDLSKFTLIEDDGVEESANPSSRQRYGNGLTRDDARIERQQQRRDEKASHEHTRHIFPWATTNAEYDVAASTLNKIYRDMVEVGQTKSFADGKVNIMEVQTKKAFNKKVRALKEVLRSWNASHPNPIKLPKRERIPDRVPLSGIPVPSPYEFQQIVSTLQFEHEMMCCYIRTCRLCGVNNQVTVASEDELSKPYKCASGTTCYRVNKSVPNFYEERNLQPIWYERESNGDYRLDSSGKRIVRYDVPIELSDLTISEQLLIRRFAPYIPSIHVRNGTLGLTGNCATFAQNIEQMCNTLPQRKESILTFVRYLGSNLSKHKYVKNLRVNRLRVLAALKWLKVHHTGYHDITICEENLDWMKDINQKVVPEKDIATEGEIDEHVRLAYEKQRDEYVSGAHEEQNDGEVECTVNQTNEQRRLPTQEQAQPIVEMIEIAESTGQEKKVQDFPSIDLDPVS